MTLLGEHLAECIGDVNHVDVAGVDLGRGQRSVDDLAGQIREVEAFFGEVSGEVALIAAEDPDISVHSRTLLQLKELHTDPRRSQRFGDGLASSRLN